MGSLAIASGGREKFFFENVGRGVHEPVGEQEGGLFRERALVEDEQELAAAFALVADALDGVRGAGGEEPEVTGADLVDEHGAVGREERDAGAAGEHDGPLVGEVPVELAERALGEAHVDAGEVLREGELALGDLVRPAAALHAAMGEIERMPDGADGAVVSGWRHVGTGIDADERGVGLAGVGGGVVVLGGRSVGGGLRERGAGGERGGCGGGSSEEVAAGWHARLDAVSFDGVRMTLRRLSTNADRD